LPLAVTLPALVAPGHHEVVRLRSAPCRPRPDRIVAIPAGRNLHQETVVLVCRTRLGNGLPGHAGSTSRPLLRGYVMTSRRFTGSSRSTSTSLNDASLASATTPAIHSGSESLMYALT